jgi:hypothetical protein
MSTIVVVVVPGLELEVIWGLGSSVGVLRLFGTFARFVVPGEA